MTRECAEVRLLARSIDALVELTGLPEEQAVARAFRRGLEILRGTAPLPETGDPDLDDLLATVLDSEAAETLNAWRVLHHLRRFEALEGAVDEGDSENRRLRTRLLGEQHVETVDVAALAQRLFSSRRRPA